MIKLIALHHIGDKTLDQSIIILLLLTDSHMIQQIAMCQEQRGW